MSGAWCIPDLGGPDNRAAAPTTAATAARIIAEMPMIDDNGPADGLFDRDETVPW